MENCLPVKIFVGRIWQELGSDSPAPARPRRKHPQPARIVAKNISPAIRPRRQPATQPAGRRWTLAAIIRDRSPYAFPDVIACDRLRRSRKKNSRAPAPEGPGDNVSDARERHDEYPQRSHLSEPQASGNSFVQAWFMRYQVAKKPQGHRNRPTAAAASHRVKHHPDSGRCLVVMNTHPYLTWLGFFGSRQ